MTIGFRATTARRVFRWALAAALWLGLAAPAVAQTPPVRVPASVGEVTVVADRLEELGADRLIVATGNVEITRGTAKLTADRVEINRDTGDAVATGRVIFLDGDTSLAAERIDYNFRTGTGVVHRGEARAAPYYRLAGERLERIAESVYRVQSGVFTTCQEDPASWTVRFGRATADLERFVWGTNASFWVRSLPLIPWLPVFAAPIRHERQTGFLIPRVGHSSRKGLFAETPFFWEISDSQDLTLGPMVYARRGFGLTADYRYVLSTEQRGSARGFLIEETERNGADRGWGWIRHTWTPSSQLSFKADVRGVTHDDVLSEYGDGLHQRGEQRVESNVFATRNWDAWSLVGNLFWYQDLTTRRPIELQRLPDLSLLSTRQPVPGVPGLLWDLDTSAVRFYRAVGSDGTRVDVHPRLARPISLAGVTVTPFLGGRVTGYDRRVTGTHLDRDRRTIEETEETLRVRQLVEAGSDVESSAARIYQLGGWQGLDALLHTIEPRVNYTRIDGRNTDRLPSWTGSDLIQDSSRVEYSLTNRIRGKTVAPAGGEPARIEMVRLVLGHSLDLQPHRRTSGDVAGDLLVQTSERLRFRGDVRHGTHGEGVQAVTTDVTVTLPRVLSSVGTRYDRPASISFLQAFLRADITRAVTGRFQSNFDMRTSTVVENRYGVDLKFQCWSITLEYVDRSRYRGGKGEDEVRVAVNLLGLGEVVTRSVGVGGLTSR